MNEQSILTTQASDPARIERTRAAVHSALERRAARAGPIERVRASAHGPLRGIEIEAIPEVLVITGANGVGKTTLLEEAGEGLGEAHPKGWAGPEETRGWGAGAWGAPARALGDPVALEYMTRVARAVHGPGAAHASAAAVGIALALGRGGLVAIDDATARVHHECIEGVWSAILGTAAGDGTQVMASASTRETVQAIATTSAALGRHAEMIRLERHGGGVRAVRYRREVLAEIGRRWVECR